MASECVISNDSRVDEKTGERPKPGCGKTCPKIKLEGLKLYKIMPDERDRRGEMKTNEDKKVELSALKVLEILNNIGERDHFLLGFD
jgi:DNA-directed RNA polymerase beta' subunit